MTTEAEDIFLDLLRRYNQSFYDRDLEALRALYVSERELVFWDNHAGCDSVELHDHLGKVGAFFAEGKATESGSVEPLIVESPHVLHTEDMAVLTAILRYQSHPHPGVRSTFVFRKEKADWKIAHIHHSFDPTEQAAQGAQSNSLR